MARIRPETNPSSFENKILPSHSHLASESVSEPGAVATGSSTELRFVRKFWIHFEIPLDPVATTPGSDTLSPASPDREKLIEVTWLRSSR